MKKRLLYLMSVMAITACGDGSTGNRNELAEQFDAEPAMMKRDAVLSGSFAGEEAPAGNITAEARIIRSGNIGLETDDLESTRRRIDSLLAKYNGYYASENFNDYDHESVYNLTARIPAALFEQFITGVESSGDRLVHKNISARDVTEEFIDLEMRLGNRRSYLQRYNDLLRQARTVADILEIQEKTRRLEEEIESVEGRLKYLDGLVEFSTLHITITRKKEFRFQPVRRDSFFERLKQSFSGGWYGLISSSLFLIRLWPLWILLLVSTALWRKYIKGKRGKQE